MKRILAGLILLVALAAAGQPFQRGVVTTNANQESAVINIVQTNKNTFTGSTNTFAGTIKQTGGGTGLLLSGALTFTSLGGNINDADGANRIGMQKATIGGLITIYDTNGTPAVTIGKDGNLTNTLKFETATERITSPGSAASIVNLALDANNNLVTNSLPVGGAQTPWAGNIAGAGHSLSGVDTIGTTNLTAELVTFGRTAAGGGKFSGNMTLMATNGYFGEFGFNFDGHSTGPNLPTQMGFSLYVTNTTSAGFGTPVLSVGKRLFSEIPVVISNTAFANSGVSNLFMTLGTNGGSVVIGPDNSLTVTSSGSITVSALTPSLPVYTDANKQLVSGTAPVTSYAAGTAYTLTGTPAQLTFGTTSPGITLATAGTYMITGTAGVKYASATYAGAQTITLKLRRTNNTAADLTSGSRAVELPVLTTFTGGDVMNTPTVIYAATAGDIVQLFGSVSATPSAGSVQTDSAEIIAVRLY